MSTPVEKVIPSKELRRVQVKTTSSVTEISPWKDIRLKELKVGNVFRMFEPDGTRVVGNLGINEWTVLEDAKLGEDGLWSVQVNN